MQTADRAFPSAAPLVVVSQSQGEMTTEEVMDWLQREGTPHLRLNGEDLHGDLPFALTLTDGRTPGPRTRFRLWTEEGEVDLAAAAGLWFRRWHTRNNLAYLFGGATVQELATGQQLHAFLCEELHVLRQALVELFPGPAGLSTPRGPGTNKLSVLRAAAAEGLAIPATLVTNDRGCLEAFVAAHGPVITKPVAECRPVEAAGLDWVMFTSALEAQDVAALPPRFFPSLFQQRVEKAYELRTFCLEGRCWSMAIFSQRHDDTRVDFRHDAGGARVRHVPFQLPPEVEEKLARLLEVLGLRTGSVDLIRTPAGEYVFLEINPVGQFGMVSAPCNYRLEQHVARYLSRLGRP